MPSHDEIDALLRTAVEKALLRQEHAKFEYRKILSDLSHRGAAREEIDRLESAGRAEMDARHELWRGLLRLNDFLKKGTVPADVPAADSEPADPLPQRRSPGRARSRAKSGTR